MTKLRGASGSTDHHTVERMYFRMFSHGQDTINREGTDSLCVCVCSYPPPFTNTYPPLSPFLPHSPPLPPTLSSTDLTSLLASAALYALVIGSELNEKASLPRDHPLLLALIQAAVSQRG